MYQTGIPAKGVRIASLARIAAGGRWHTEAMRSLAQPVLYWFEKGTGRITLQGTSRAYAPGHAVLVPAGVAHGFTVDPGVDGTAIFLLEGTEPDMPSAPLHVICDTRPAREVIAARIDALCAEVGRAAGPSPRALFHHAGLLVIALVRQAEAGVPAETTHETASGRLSAAFALLLERDGRPGRSVSDYATQLGITPTHLSRVCRATTGRPASEILQDRVHSEARRLLRETSLPVKDVAARLGFRSAAYFTRAFQNRCGRTPSDFRRGD